MTTERTRVGAYALCWDAEALLLCRLSAPPERWTLPGGGLDHGEDPQAAAVREVREETGYEVAIERLIGIDSFAWTSSDGDESIHGIRILYAARVVGGALRHEANGSTDVAAWVPRSKLAHLPLVELVESALAMDNRAAQPPADS